MNCAQHPETPATAFCRECGKPMCPDCQRPALGSVYCDVHLPAAAAPPAPYTPSPYIPPPYTTPPGSSPYTAPVTPAAPDYSVHPVLALLLGLIPGVGAIYNGQYAKGLVHAIVFGLLVSVIANGHGNNGGMDALVGIMIAAWVFYMAFEAYHTARKRRFGVTVEELSDQFDFHAGGGRFPTGAALLIGLGFLLLLDTTDIISIDDIGRYWPIGLIVLGVWLLYSRLNPARGPEHINPEHSNPENINKDAEVRR
jgi:hypothetical protein